MKQKSLFPEPTRKERLIAIAEELGVSYNHLIGLIVDKFLKEYDNEKMPDKMLKKEFEEVWKILPRKKGSKKISFKYYKDYRKQGYTLNYFLKCATIFAHEMKVEGRPIDKILNGETWLSPTGERFKQYEQIQPTSQPDNDDWGDFEHVKGINN